MGIFSFIANRQVSQKPQAKNQVDAKIRASAERSVKEMMDIFARGGSTEEAHEAIMRPDNFHECKGGLAISAEHILPIYLDIITEKKLDERTVNFFWDPFMRDQKYCDEFFFGSEMRIWVIARTWRHKYPNLTWEQIDMCLKGIGVNVDRYRDSNWWRVACFEYLADQGHEDRDDFQAAWKSMTAEDCRAVVNSLEQGEVDVLKLED